MSFQRMLMIAHAAADIAHIPITFTAERAGSGICIKYRADAASTDLPTDDIFYRRGTKGPWIPYQTFTDGNSGEALDLENVGDCVQLWCANSRGFSYHTTGPGLRGIIARTGNVNSRITVTGNLHSLCNWETHAPSGASFCMLFANMLTYFRIRLYIPETDPSWNRFNGTFQSWTQNGNLLESLHVGFKTWGTISNWITSAPATGTFIKPAALPEEFGERRIPNGWTVVNK